MLPTIANVIQQYLIFSTIIIGFDVCHDDPHEQQNFENLNILSKGTGVSYLSWNENYSSILLGREDGIIKTFSVANNTLVEEVKLESGKIRGICEYKKYVEYLLYLKYFVSNNIFFS